MKRKDLGEKVLNSAKHIVNNSWKAIPWIGFLGHLLDIQYSEEDKYYNEKIHPSMKGFGKILSHLGWSVLGTLYVVAGSSTSLGWNPLEYKEKGKEYEIQQKQKSFVIQYIDKDNNGLNIQEDYQIKELMDIQDSSKTYVPTFKDWERAYNKIK